ncbi:MAG TPA: hydroxyacid dehydrogenase [Flavobacteriales bacterium]|nr:hydroxyacid dehydrogenase [Flavobacteriales bacterium]
MGSPDHKEPIKVLFADIVHPILNEELEKMNFTCENLADKKGQTIEELLPYYEGLIIRSKVELDKKQLDNAKKLKFIARAGAGMESINVEYAESMGIHCINAPEGNKDAVADHVIGMILALFKNLHIADSEVRKGMWNREANRGLELTGKTVGIIGYGFTGGEVGKRLKGFGVKVLAYDKYKSEFSDDYVTETTLERIYEEADILSLHLPLTPETEFMVDGDFFNRFKKNIYLINTSRGKVVNTAELVKCLKSGKVLGACLDVLEYESASFERLKGLGMWTNKRGVLINNFGAWLMKIGALQYRHPVQYLVKSKKVLLSPHIAGWSVESYKKISLILLERIKKLNLHS